MSSGDPQCSECGQYLSLGHRATCGQLRRNTASSRDVQPWVCPACGVGVGMCHAGDCDVLAAKGDGVDPACSPSDVRPPHHSYRKIPMPVCPDCGLITGDLHGLVCSGKHGSVKREIKPMHGGRPMTLGEVAAAEGPFGDCLRAAALGARAVDETTMEPKKAMAVGRTATEVMQRDRCPFGDILHEKSSGARDEAFLHNAGVPLRASGDDSVSRAAAPTDSPADPWAHRSAKMRCRTCMWWVQKDLSEGGMTHGVSRVNGKTVATRRMGRCRRHAPTLNGYPAVWSDDWCGDHKLDEAKA